MNLPVTYHVNNVLKPVANGGHLLGPHGSAAVDALCCNGLHILTAMGDFRELFSSKSIGQGVTIDLSQSHKTLLVGITLHHQTVTLFPMPALDNTQGGSGGQHGPVGGPAHQVQAIP